MSSCEDCAEAVHKAERNVEKTYRNALVELFDVGFADDFGGGRKEASGGADDLYQRVLRDVMARVKRREIYRHLSNSADRLALAGNTLHDIIVKIA